MPRLLPKMPIACINLFNLKNVIFVVTEDFLFFYARQICSSKVSSPVQQPTQEQLSLQNFLLLTMFTSYLWYAVSTYVIFMVKQVTNFLTAIFQFQFYSVIPYLVYRIIVIKHITYHKT